MSDVVAEASKAVLLEQHAGLVFTSVTVTVHDREVPSNGPWIEREPNGHYTITIDCKRPGVE